MRTLFLLGVLAIGCGGSTINGDELVGRGYYYMDAGKTCTTNTFPPTSVAVSGSIKFIRESDGTIDGDILSACSDVVEMKPFSVFQISDDLKTLTYLGVTYTYAATPPSYAQTP